MITLCFNNYSHPDKLVRFLTERLATNHREQLLQLLAAGTITVDGEITKTDCVIKPAHQIAITLPDHYEDGVDTHWQMIWENEELMAVYKPHGLPVSRTTRNLYHTLISLVRRETPYHRAHLLHRLDTETDGLVLLAKTDQADKKWKRQLDQLMIEKRYLARVTGETDWQQIAVTNSLSTRPDSKIRSQMYVIDEAESERFPNAKQCTTRFNLLKRSKDFNLIECELLTGRKHQIRCQLSHLGLPIIGDKIYSHNGNYYLKRLEQPLTDQDYRVLGAHFHQLTAHAVTLKYNEQLIHLTLPSKLLQPLPDNLMGNSCS